jgi:hypothetical protein
VHDAALVEEDLLPGDVDEHGREAGEVGEAG